MMRLVPLDEPTLGHLLSDPEEGLRALGSNSGDVLEFFKPLLAHSLQFQRSIACQAPWHGYLGVESEENRLVGICSFQGDPNAQGEVEISYCTVPKYEGRGYATEMARALLAIAFAAPDVQRVIAHTLPVPNPSTRVLHKAGLKKTGEVIHPEDGKVWRWQIDRNV